MEAEVDYFRNQKHQALVRRKAACHGRRKCSVDIGGCIHITSFMSSLSRNRSKTVQNKEKNSAREDVEHGGLSSTDTEKVNVIRSVKKTMLLMYWVIHKLVE